jgi:hypothetical protein
VNQENEWDELRPEVTVCRDGRAGRYKLLARLALNGLDAEIVGAVAPRGFPPVPLAIRSTIGLAWAVTRAERVIRDSIRKGWKMQATPATEPVLPIVHLNGTTRTELVELRANCVDSLREAGRMLAAMAPNGRDYYPEPGRMDRAVEQHDRRMNALRELINEIEAEMLAVDRLWFAPSRKLPSIPLPVAAGDHLTSCENPHTVGSGGTW